MTKVIWEKDLAVDSPIPWYLPLDKSHFSLSSFRLTAVGRFITKNMVSYIYSTFAASITIPFPLKFWNNPILLLILSAIENCYIFLSFFSICWKQFTSVCFSLLNTGQGPRSYWPRPKGKSESSRFSWESCGRASWRRKVSIHLHRTFFSS